MSKLHTYEYKLIMDELIIGSQLTHIVCTYVVSIFISSLLSYNFKRGLF